MEEMLKAEGTKHPRYYQCYNIDWEKLPIFKGWLAPVPDNKHKAFCKYCRKQFRAHRTDLRTHARSRKHQRAGDLYFSTNKNNAKESKLNPVASRINFSSSDENPIVIDEATESMLKLSENDLDVSSSDGSPDSKTPVVSSTVSLSKTDSVPSPVPQIISSLPHAGMQSLTIPEVNIGIGGISTQVLDLVRGIPVSRMAVTLLLECGSIWSKISDGITDVEGRCSLLKPQEVVEGRYKMHFEVKKYFTLGLHDTFYPYIEVTFEVSELSELYHVPLLLSPYGYMVYRGR